MSMNHIGEYESPIGPDSIHQQTPIQIRSQTTERTTHKRPRSNISPQGQMQFQAYRQEFSSQQQMTHPNPVSKISFPPIIVKFNEVQSSSIKEITDDLVLNWKRQHGISLKLTARFGHMHSLLIFADDSSTFESLLDPTRWPKTLREVGIVAKAPRQLPPDYSLIIQQFHRNWNEDEWLHELQLKYVSLFKITRIRVKDGSPLNAVRADFKSIDEVKTLTRSGKINIGSMIHPIKPYYVPLLINKCQKCLRHDHSTSSCSRPRLCPRCAQQHSLENGCPNKEKCANCEGDHISGHPACPIVQERRRTLVDQSKKQRAELLVLAERHQHQYDYSQDNYTTLNNKNRQFQSSQPPLQTADAAREHHAHVTKHQQNQGPQQNMEYTLSTFLDKMERRLQEFTFRLSSQLCEIEKKLNAYSEQQNNVEKIVHEILLPSMQVLSRSALQSTKKKSNNEELKNLSQKINDILAKPKHQTDNHSQRISLNRIDSPTDNEFN